MSSGNTDYFRSRVMAERDLAKSAAEPRIAAIHERLARSYEALVKDEEMRLTVTVGSAPINPVRPSAYWLSAAAYAPR